MARAASNTGVHLRRLATAKPRIAKLKRGEVLSSMPMAEILSVRWPALRDWCDGIEGFEASGAFVRGGNGVEWKFYPRKVHAFLTAHFSKEAARDNRATKRSFRAAGADVETEMGLHEATKSFALASAIKRQRREDGELCEVAHVDHLWENSMGGIQKRVMSIVTKYDPNGNLHPSERARLDAVCREALLEIYDDNKELKGTFDAALQREGTV